MSRWLDRLKNIENTPNKHCQNRQKAINETFGRFVSASSGDFQKNLPAVITEEQRQSTARPTTGYLINPEAIGCHG